MARNDYKGADDHGLRLKGSPHFLSNSFFRLVYFLFDDPFSEFSLLCKMSTNNSSHKSYSNHTT